jgi:ankyrin repeat protein
MIRFSNFLTALFTLLSIAGFTSIQAQSIFNLFEENNTLKIQEWIKANPSGQIDILNDRLHDFYEKRLPAQKLNCVADKMNILELAILSGNSIIYNELLSMPNYSQNKEILSQALNFAISKNNAELFKKLESMGATYNAKSAYFFNQNSLQIAFTFAPGSELTKKIMEKSTSADFNHLDCLGNTALHYLASNKTVDLSKFPIEKMNNQLFTRNEETLYPIDYALQIGDLNNIKLLWSLMNKHDNFAKYSAKEQYIRLRYYASISGNNQTLEWVDNIVLTTFHWNDKKLHNFYHDDNKFDLTEYLDKALMISEYFFDLKLLDPSVKETTYQSLINSWQNLINEELNLKLKLKLDFHKTTNLLSFKDLKYTNQFFLDYYWYNLFNEKQNPKQLESTLELQTTFFYFSDLPSPKTTQSNYVVDFDFLIGFNGTLEDRMKFFLTQLNVSSLTVKDAFDFNFEYYDLFPKLSFIEIQWTNLASKEYYLTLDLLKCKTIKLIGVQKTIFPPNIGKINLETIIVPTDAELVDLPKGVKVLYE